MFFTIPIFIKPSEPQPMPASKEDILIKELFAILLAKPRVRQIQNEYLVKALDVNDESMKKSYISMSRSFGRQFESMERLEASIKKELSDLHNKEFAWIKEKKK